MQYENTFGGFIRKKRRNLVVKKRQKTEVGMSEDDFARYVGISVSHLRALEMNIYSEPRLKPMQKVLENMVDILELNESEKELFFELVEKAKENTNNTHTVTPTLDYIHANESVRKALKVAQEIGLTNEDWEKIADEFIKRKTGRDDI